MTEQNGAIDYRDIISHVTPELIEALTDEERFQLLEYVEQLRRLLATENYADYVEYVHGKRWIWGRHLQYLCNEIQQFIDADTGNPYDIMAISWPPQHGKSMSVTETLPSYFMGQNPYKRCIIAAYNDDLANRFGRRNRDKVRQFGGDLFAISLARSPNSDSNFELENKVGACISKGMRSGITGNPAELVIIDDPIKDKMEADSMVFRNRVWDEWQNAIKTRLAPGAKVIVIMTRWHEDDLVGRLIDSEGLVETGGTVRYINLPCEAEENDPLGRQPGEPLFPEIGRHAEWLAKTKASFMNDPHTGGASAWYALYQGRPKILEGNMFKEGWFKLWFPRTISKPAPVSVIMPDGNRGMRDSEPLPLSFEEYIQAWDMTFKDEVTNDFVVGTVWGRYGIDFYMLDMIRRQMDVVETLESIEILSKKWPQATLKLIEDAANGPAVIQMLRKNVTGLVSIPARQSKKGRAQATQVYFESGHIFIPHPAVHSWSNIVRDEFTSFPNGIHDDIVDSSVHAITRLGNSVAGMLHMGKEQSTNATFSWRKRINTNRRQAKGRARVI